MEIKPIYIQSVVIAVAVVCFSLVCAKGFQTGVAIARTKLVQQQSGALTKSLALFFADQDRFPSAQEFSDQQIFGVYATPVPITTVASKQCPVVLEYESLTFREFALRYCTPRAVGDVPAGYHEITNRQIGL